MALFNYYDFQIGLAVSKVNEEIEFFTKSEYANEYIIRERVTYLQNRLGMNKPLPRVLSSFDRNGIRREIKKMNIDDYTKDISNMMYELPWKKLKEFHKIAKFDEYVDSLIYDKKVPDKKRKKNRDMLKAELKNGMADKRYAKGKTVIDYNQKKMLIDSISSVYLDPDSNLYEIDWDM